MKSPWEEMQLSHYEAHMSLAGIEQMQALAQITKCQLAAFPAQSVAILGITGGNGLLHIPDSFRKIVGIDINQDYLNVCKERYGNLGDRLELLRMDLSQYDAQLPHVDLVLANLLVEYIGINRFAALMRTCSAQFISCAIQVNVSSLFVSVSPYTALFDKIGELHQDIEPNQLNEAMEKAGYAKLREINCDLQNGKRLLRMDYAKQGI